MVGQVTSGAGKSSPRMGWIGVVDQLGYLWCWSCATVLNKHGTLIQPGTYHHGDCCDRCGSSLNPPDEAR